MFTLIKIVLYLQDCGKRKSSGTVCPSPVSLFVVWLWLWSHSFVKADHAALLLRAIRRSIIAFRIQAQGCYTYHQMVLMVRYRHNKNSSTSQGCNNNLFLLANCNGASCTICIVIGQCESGDRVEVVIKGLQWRKIRPLSQEAVRFHVFISN